MNFRRGISPLVSWVLLIGFVVGLSLMVGNWVRTQAQTTTDDVVKNVESDIRCSDVSFNAKIDDCLGAPRLNLTNTGKFTISEVRVRQPGHIEPYKVVIPVNEQKTQGLSNFENTQDADIIPVITVGKNSIVCSARKVVVKKCP
tara:strand:- start:19 stop:450 length:432 start_codon:yes stop_codon:yes gene_type:complete